MPDPKPSLFSTRDLTLSQIHSLFHRAKSYKNSWKRSPQGFFSEEFSGATVVLAFLEPSTRTRLSFEMAAHRLNIKVISFSDLSSSSVQKGESLFETFKNISHLGPDLFVIRWKEPLSLWEELKTLGRPFINAGAGSWEHPTQALLDAFTLKEQFGDLEGLKVLFYGDIKHSRVFSSHQKLLTDLGAEVLYSCPESLSPEASLEKGVKRVPSFQEALSLCDAVVGLRTQEERMEKSFDFEELKSQYQLNKKTLKALRGNSIIMHPGPFHLGVEITEDVLNDKRVRIYHQVENSVYVRAALMGLYLESSRESFGE